MNTLRNHILQEVTKLDIKSLVVLQSILPILKQTPPMTKLQLRGAAAAHCRQELHNLKGSLAQTIIEEREERL